MIEHLTAYRALCASKRSEPLRAGISRTPELNSTLRDHQRAGVEFALRAGRSALFYDTGLGKTRMMLDWGRCVVEYANKPVLMLAPLAVGAQHLLEAEAMGVEASISRFGQPPSSPRVVITNYERLERFDPADYAGVILDESSILKSFTGATTRKLIEAFRQTPFRLAGSATPAPNDHTELGQHSAFLGVMPSSEMLSRFFIADQANAGVYRLKKAAIRPFWDWVASWARCVSKPSDLGFSDDGYNLPALDIVKHLVRADRMQDAGEEKNGQFRMFRIPERSATSIHKEKRLTAADRAAQVAEIVAGVQAGDPICIWVDTDYEAEAVRAAVPEAIEVSGKMHADVKEERLSAFSRGELRILLTKPSIAGYGLNWQHCNQAVFTGLSFSYEAFYQAVRRFWRFGQPRPVSAHVVMADTEAEIVATVQRKAGDHERMKSEMSAAMRRAAVEHTTLHTYNPDQGGHAAGVDLGMTFDQSDIERFMRFVDKLPNGCWFWAGARSRGKGNRKWYGSFKVKGRAVRAHRFACEAIGGNTIQPGEHRDHTCCFSLCLNPNHLEIVSHEENQHRKMQRKAA